MAGVGVERRLAILRDTAEQQVLKPFRTHGWTADIVEAVEDGEYLVIAARREQVARRVALLYSPATSNTIYKRLDKQVERIFMNGDLSNIESYAHDIAVPVEPLAHFFSQLVEWNKALVPPAHGVSFPPVHRPARTRHIRAENPIEEVWARLDQYASVRLAAKLITRRVEEHGSTISGEPLQTKAEGLAFSLRNASDYYRRSPHESLNKRVLNLYYGTLSLAFAEMLASPLGPADLDEVEGMTKFGHGLYVLAGARAAFGEIMVGALGTGFFPRWMAFLGHDITAYPKKKGKPGDTEGIPPGMLVSIEHVLARIPELSDFFSDVGATDPMWAVPIFDFDANPSFQATRNAVQPPSSAYVTLLDPSGRLTTDMVKRLAWPLAEVAETRHDAEGVHIRVRVDHEGSDFWHEVLPVHRSPFLNRLAVIFPFFGGVAQYRALGLAALYTLSILVRYMPSVWRRIEGGDLDQHLTLVRECISVLERVLPEKFLEVVTGEGVHARQTDGGF